MIYDEAYNLIKETYSGYLQMTNKYSIDYGQGCIVKSFIMNWIENRSRRLSYNLKIIEQNCRIRRIDSIVSKR